ncbi:MAG: ThuA domain-containing protein [Planctomycetales bacterium]|nr:ThuA domain-containing protein [Planctomycetales bacterium]
MRQHFSIVGCGLLFIAVCAAATCSADDRWVTYEGKQGPGKGKHVVLISGDEEYRSEEALPQLGKILALQHGFTCTVLFALDPDGTINPNNSNNIPGLEHLDNADLMIIATRFRDLPDDQMKHIDDYLKTGKPVIGMRTATHAFNIKGDKPYAHYGNGYGGKMTEWKDGFGRLVLGEKWISHHGGHKRESTRGLIAEDAKDHPVARGLRDGDVWGNTDVYGVRLPLPGDSQPIVLGQVLVGMNPEDAPLEGKKNDPMMPVGWVKSYEVPGGKKGRVFNTTMGAATDLTAAGTRRMLVNAAYWCVGLEDQIPAEGAKADLVGDFQPTMYGFGGFKKGLKPADFGL